MLGGLIEIFSVLKLVSRFRRRTLPAINMKAVKVCRGASLFCIIDHSYTVLVIARYEMYKDKSLCTIKTHADH